MQHCTNAGLNVCSHVPTNVTDMHNRACLNQPPHYDYQQPHTTPSPTACFPNILCLRCYIGSHWRCCTRPHCIGCSLWRPWQRHRGSHGGSAAGFAHNAVRGAGGRRKWCRLRHWRGIGDRSCTLQRSWLTSTPLDDQYSSIFLACMLHIQHDNHFSAAHAYPYLVQEFLAAGELLHILS